MPVYKTSKRQNEVSTSGHTTKLNNVHWFTHQFESNIPDTKERSFYLSARLLIYISNKNELLGQIAKWKYVSTGISFSRWISKYGLILLYYVGSLHLATWEKSCALYSVHKIGVYFHYINLKNRTDEKYFRPMLMSKHNTLQFLMTFDKLTILSAKSWK